jgi:hypothetical protein
MAVSDNFDKFRKSHGNLGDSNDNPIPVTRFLGGKGRSIQWHTSGTFYVILSPPDKIFNGSSVAPSEGTGGASVVIADGLNSTNFEKWIQATCETFTPHTVTPGFVEHTGLGGLKSAFYNGRNEVTNEFSLGFREVQGLPILQGIHMWASFNDPWYGVTNVDGDEVVPSSYKGDCYILKTRPSVSGDREINERDIEQVYYYDGVFPKNVPLDSYNEDITTGETVQVTVQFSFDGFPLDKKDKCVLERAITEFNNRFKWIHMYERHYKCDDGPFIKDNKMHRGLYGKRGGYNNPGRGDSGS